MILSQYDYVWGFVGATAGMIHTKDLLLPEQI